jgi:hypothetical protein
MLKPERPKGSMSGIERWVIFEKYFSKIDIHPLRRCGLK